MPAHALKELWGLRWVGESLCMVCKRCLKAGISVRGLSVGKKRAAYSWSVSTSVGEVSVSRDKERITDVSERKWKKHGNRKWGNNPLKYVAKWCGEISIIYKAWVKLGDCGLSQKKTFSFSCLSLEKDPLQGSWHGSGRDYTGFRVLCPCPLLIPQTGWLWWQ